MKPAPWTLWPVLTFAIVCGLPAEVSADDASAVDWLKANAHPVRTLDPTDTDFEDLAALKAHVGDARIVGLGEQTHGDGATFLAKCRLIRFLHQEMGFDLIAFESGLYDCRKAWDAFKEGELDPVEAARQGVFGIWTHSAQVKPLFDYVAEQASGEQPLELCGFDCQMTARATPEGLIEDLGQLLENNGIRESKTFEAASTLLRAIADSDAKPAERARRKGREALEEIRAALEGVDAKGGDAREIVFWRQVLTSLLAQFEVRWPPKRADGPEATNARDAQMARNLVWLADTYYPGRKLILWAASFHLLRNAPEVERGRGVDYRNTVPMGHGVHEHFKDDYYSVAFGAFDGYGGRPWDSAPWDIGEAPKGSIEALCVAADLDRAWFPLRGVGKDGAWLLKKQVARPLGNAPMRAVWPNHFDAYFFIRTMTPSTSVDDAAPKPSAAVAQKPLLPEVEKQWATIQRGLRQGNQWVDKWDLVNAFDEWRNATGADAAAIQREMVAVEAWGKDLAKETGFTWRLHHLFGAMAVGAEDGKLALEHYDKALAAYPEKEYGRPSAQSKFQHIVNARAMLTVDEKNVKAATKFVSDLLAKDVRFRYFYAQPLVQALAAAGKAKQVKTLYKAVEKAYGKRRKRFPEFRDEIDGFLQELR